MMNIVTTSYPNHVQLLSHTMHTARRVRFSSGHLRDILPIFFHAGSLALRKSHIYVDANNSLSPSHAYMQYEILTETHICSFRKIHLKMSSGKWQPFCLGLNVWKISWWVEMKLRCNTVNKSVCTFYGRYTPCLMTYSMLNDKHRTGGIVSVIKARQ